MPLGVRLSNRASLRRESTLLLPQKSAGVWRGCYRTQVVVAVENLRVAEVLSRRRRVLLRGVGKRVVNARVVY